MSKWRSKRGFEGKAFSEFEVWREVECLKSIAPLTRSLIPEPFYMRPVPMSSMLSIPSLLFWTPATLARIPWEGIGLLTSMERDPSIPSLPAPHLRSRRLSYFYTQPYSIFRKGPGQWRQSWTPKYPFADVNEKDPSLLSLPAQHLVPLRLLFVSFLPTSNPNLFLKIDFMTSIARAHQYFSTPFHFTRLWT